MSLQMEIWSQTNQFIKMRCDRFSDKKTTMQWKTIVGNDEAQEGFLWQL